MQSAIQPPDGDVFVLSFEDKACILGAELGEFTYHRRTPREETRACARVRADLAALLPAQTAADSVITALVHLTAARLSMWRFTMNIKRCVAFGDMDKFLAIYRSGAWRIRSRGVAV